MTPTVNRHILSICSLGVFCILAAGSMDSSSSSPSPPPSEPAQSSESAQAKSSPQVVAPVLDTSVKREKYAEAVSSACGWKSIPQVAGYQIGMSLGEAQKLGGSNLKCEESAPITSGSIFDMLNDHFLAPDSDVGDPDDNDGRHGSARAAVTCDTLIDGNDIHLWFFPDGNGGPPSLGEAINALDSSAVTNQEESIAKGLSEKYGVDIANRQQVCSKPSGLDADFAMDVSVTQPICSIPSSPDQSPDAGCILMQDRDLIRRGGRIIEQRDAAGVKAAENDAAEKARKAAEANRY